MNTEIRKSSSFGDCDRRELTRENYMDRVNELIIKDICDRTNMDKSTAERLIIPYRFFCDCSAFVSVKFTFSYRTPDDEELVNCLPDLIEIFGYPNREMKETFFRLFLQFEDSDMLILSTYEFKDIELAVLYCVRFLCLLGTDVVLKTVYKYKLKNLLKDLQTKLLKLLLSNGVNKFLLHDPMSDMLEDIKADCVGYTKDSEEYNRFISLFVEYYFISLNDGLNFRDARDYAASEALRSALFSSNNGINENTFRSLVINVNNDYSRSYIINKFNK